VRLEGLGKLENKNYRESNPRPSGLQQFRLLLKITRKMDRQMDGWMDGWTDGQIDK
jgi:hypothetical protein